MNKNQLTDTPLTLITDDKIPLVCELFGQHATIIQIPGREITPSILNDADILLVRTVTKIDAKSLKDSPVKFVGTPTAGVDHLDTEWLEQVGIRWANAPGCNAKAVAEYVLACVVQLQQQDVLTNTACAGVIGVGQVGSKVASALAQIGFDVLTNDPPRAEHDPDFYCTPLSELTECDLICLHTPLTHCGDHSTFHLINHEFLSELKPGCVILNAGRGSVIDQRAVLTNPQLHYCFDVWENEPNINLDILKQALIATPHIAGYSIEAKKRATYQVFAAASELFGWPIDEYVSIADHPLLPIEKEGSWCENLLDALDPSALSQQMKNTLASSDNIARSFIDLRRGYALRHETLSDL